MNAIDLNCDVGEGFNNESELLPLISSCNIACGKHAGSPVIMRSIIKLALEHDVAIGAHPSFDDRENFGRVEHDLSPEELSKLVRDQILILMEICSSEGAKMSHVKPHGALYNLAAKSTEVSETIISVITSIDPELKLVGLAKSKTEQAAKGKITFVSEGFADRKYQSATRLMPRDQDGLIVDFREIKDHIASILLHKEVETPNGKEPIDVKSLCLHGDTPSAVKLLPRIVKEITDLGFTIQAP